MSYRLGALPIACALAGPLAGPLAAQSAPPPAVAAADPLPTTIEACYVPASGTIYRINTAASPAPGAPGGCLSTAHQRFSWNRQGPQGPPGPAGPQGPAGPAGTATAGPDLALPGTLGVGGTTTLGGGLALQTPNGFTPTAPLLLLRDAPAGGSQVFAVTPGGYLAARSLGVGGNANVAGGLTVGAGAAVTGPLSASGSVALGPRGAANGKAGAFVFGDNSSPNAVGADANNQFLVRAAGGVRLRTSADQSKGCNVDDGGNLVCTGSVTAAGGAAAAGGPGGAFGALAVGRGAAALGEGSVAAGASAVARAAGGVALGTSVEAIGRGATAVGTAAVAGGEGSFVYGDASTGTHATATAPNEFLVRAAGGVRLRTASDLSRGCDISTEGALSCTGGVALAGSLSLVREPGQWVTIAAHSLGQPSATCPAGTSLLGGGVESEGDYVRVSFASYDARLPETFTARVMNEIGISIRARVSVTCLRLTR